MITEQNRFPSYIQSVEAQIFQFNVVAYVYHLKNCQQKPELSSMQKKFFFQTVNRIIRNQSTIKKTPSKFVTLHSQNKKLYTNRQICRVNFKISTNKNKGYQPLSRQLSNKTLFLKTSKRKFDFLTLCSGNFWHILKIFLRRFLCRKKLSRACFLHFFLESFY